MRFILLLCALILVTSCGELNETTIDVATLSATVTRVIDGDTLVVTFDNGKEERVRLLLIDTPETVHPSKPIEPFGPEASDYTKQLLSNKNVELEFDVAERDKYGRILAYVWVEGQMVNELLLAQGLARVVVYQPNVKYVEKFRAIEKEAQKEKRGIWSVEDYATSGISYNAAEALFIASRHSDVYHEINCPGGADKIAAQNAIYFATEEKAKASGRRMCQSKNCSLH